MASPHGEVGAKRPSNHEGGHQRKLHQLRMGHGLRRGDSLCLILVMGNKLAVMAALDPFSVIRR